MNGDNEFNATSLIDSMIKKRGHLSIDILKYCSWIPHVTLRNSKLWYGLIYISHLAVFFYFFGTY